ncbi:hypothetical protein D3C85_1070910 [compost metagenome]
MQQWLAERRVPRQPQPVAAAGIAADHKTHVKAAQAGVGGRADDQRRGRKGVHAEVLAGNAALQAVVQLAARQQPVLAVVQRRIAVIGGGGGVADDAAFRGGAQQLHGIAADAGYRRPLQDGG